MSNATINWRGQSYAAKTKAIIERQLNIAATVMVADVKKSFGSPKKMPKGQRTPVMGYRMKAKTYRSYQHSKEGDPPFIQTGHLKRSIQYDSPKPLTRRVGSTMQSKNGGYAMHLELGTQKMAARPFLRPALQRIKSRIKTLVTGR